MITTSPNVTTAGPVKVKLLLLLMLLVLVLVLLLLLALVLVLLMLLALVLVLLLALVLVLVLLLALVLVLLLLASSYRLEINEMSELAMDDWVTLPFWRCLCSVRDEHIISPRISLKIKSFPVSFTLHVAKHSVRFIQ